MLTPIGTCHSLGMVKQWVRLCHCGIHGRPTTSLAPYLNLSKFKGWGATLKNLRVMMVELYYDSVGSIAAVNKLHKQTFIALQFCGSQVQYRSHWKEVSGGCVPFWRPREDCFLLINVILRIKFLEVVGSRSLDFTGSQLKSISSLLSPSSNTAKASLVHLAPHLFGTFFCLSLLLLRTYVIGLGPSGQPRINCSFQSPWP